jgi:hypothetical protein
MQEYIRLYDTIQHYTTLYKTIKTMTLYKIIHDTKYYTKEDYTTLHNITQHHMTLYKAIRYYTMLIVQNYTTLYKTFKNSLIIDEENTKKNHKRVVSLYVDKDFPSFT